MIGKSFYTICFWLFYNTINYEIPRDNNSLTYIKYTYRDTTHTLYFDNSNTCVEDYIELKK